MYIPISENGEQFYNEHFVVRFFKEDGADWIANFSKGWGIDKVFEYPNRNMIVVFAGGIGYIMNPNQAKPLKILRSMAKEVFQIDSGELVCIDDTEIGKKHEKCNYRNDFKSV